MRVSSAIIPISCLPYLHRNNNVSKGRRWEEAGILAVAMCSLHIPKGGLNAAPVTQQRQQPELCARSGLSFPRWVPMRPDALKRWCSQCPSSFSAQAHSGWWQQHFCHFPAELSWQLVTHTKEQHMRQMMPAERLGRVMRIDVDFLSFFEHKS